jgi:hypothetical protein
LRKGAMREQRARRQELQKAAAAGELKLMRRHRYSPRDKAIFAQFPGHGTLQRTQRADVVQSPRASL